MKKPSPALERKMECREPEFALHRPPFGEIVDYRKKFRKLKNIVVIGNGGSVTSFQALHGALAEKSGKRATVLSTMEPFRVTRVKKENPRANTLVMPVSKSGNNTDMLEASLQFLDYRMLAVTGGGALGKIAGIKGIPVIEHPDIAGRFSGMTASALAPAGICGLPVKEMFRGARKCYRGCAPSVEFRANDAKKLAFALYGWERRGFTEIFMPVYSSRLSEFLPLAGQLVHETLGKKGKGLSLLAGEAPEAQHHTLQRVFGGRRNAGILFLREEKFREKMRLKVPREIRRVKLHHSFLKSLDGLPCEKSLEFDFLGVQKTAKGKGIPSAEIRVERVSAESVGSLLAFLQYFAFYSALLRGVNAFNQPSVEKSKKTSFEMRKHFAGKK